MSEAMPANIAGAILKVISKSKQLGFDERNPHGGYNYVSVDKFFETLAPVMAEAGLLMIVEEEDISYREGPPNREGRVTTWATIKYAISLAHESGESWGPLHRTLALPITGPQTFAAAESFARKYFMRGLFMIPTGEHDADEVAPSAFAAPVPVQQATRAHPAVAPASPARDRAVAAFRTVRNALDEIADRRVLERIAGGEWPQSMVNDALALQDYAPDALGQLMAHARRILETREPEPEPPATEESPWPPQDEPVAGTGNAEPEQLRRRVRAPARGSILAAQAPDMVPAGVAALTETAHKAAATGSRGLGQFFRTLSAAEVASIKDIEVQLWTEARQADG